MTAMHPVERMYFTALAWAAASLAALMLTFALLFTTHYLATAAFFAVSLGAQYMARKTRRHAIALRRKYFPDWSGFDDRD